MSRARARALATVAALVAAVAPGCGFGEGEASEGEATLTVTRDYGTTPMFETTVSDPTESDTVIRVLDREAELKTRYGGGFVHAIDGVAGGVEGGRSLDWFFFVNGIESDRGSADVVMRAGDRVWWDYRDWTDAMRTPAVVGSYPEPFAQAAAGGEALPVRVECAGDEAPCDEVAARLADDGVDAETAGYDGGRGSGSEAIRVLVGPWAELERDPVAGKLAGEPQTSGVFARFEDASDGDELVVLDERAEEARRLGEGAGLVAALREGEDPPTWVVAGTDPAGVSAAAERLTEEALAHRYALAVDGGEEVPVPEVAAG